jgi:hypothetical protein
MEDRSYSLINPSKMKRICVSPYRAVNTLHHSYKPGLYNDSVRTAT